MRLPRRLLALVLLLPLLVACAARTAADRPDPTPDLSGAWEFDMDVGSHVTLGAFTLERRADGYGGELTTNRGPNRLPVRSVALARDSVTMVVESPNGLVTFHGVLAGDARTMTGKVLYHNGQTYPMSVRRRVEQGG